jgi:nicotinamidase-related amidase
MQMVRDTKDIDTLVVFRIATSGVVLSTLLHACDADYQLGLHAAAIRDHADC